ncbi:hypothetical protein [Legionella lansingensis]|nr:hypothetical protein [Legionella lansingensis]
MDSRYLQEYWRQLETEHVFDRILAQLSQYTPYTSVLKKIKASDDKLRLQEIAVLKLIFSAYHIPEEVIHPKIAAYRLSGAQEIMTDAEKLQTARDILFSVNHEKELQNTQRTIQYLKKLLDEHLQSTIVAGRRVTHFFVATLITLSIFLVLIIASILWLRLIDK